MLPTQKKCNDKKNHTYLNLVYSICQKVDIYKACKTFDFVFLLLFLLSSPPSTTALRFPHYFSPMNISLGKAIQFRIPSASVPSSSSSTVTTFFEGFLLQWKRGFVLKQNLNVAFFAKEVSHILFHITITICF